MAEREDGTGAVCTKSAPITTLERTFAGKIGQNKTETTKPIFQITPASCDLGFSFKIPPSANDTHLAELGNIFTF